MAKVRGRTIIPVRAFLKESFGDHGWKRVLAELTPAQRTIVDGFMLPDSWYEREVHSALLRAAVKVHGHDMPDVSRRIGVRVAQHHDKFYIRPLLKLGGVKMVVKRAASLYRDYYQGGEMILIEQRDSGGRLRVEDPDAPAELCEGTLIGFIEEIIRLAGREPVFVKQSACKFAGGTACEIDFEWR